MYKYGQGRHARAQDGVTIRHKKECNIVLCICVCILCMYVCKKII